MTNIKTCPLCGAPVSTCVSEDYHTDQSQIEYKYEPPATTTQEPTYYGYDMDEIRLAVELLRNHGIRPDDLHDLKDNFGAALAILQKEQERIQRAAIEQMMEGLGPTALDKAREDLLAKMGRANARKEGGSK